MDSNYLNIICSQWSIDNTLSLISIILNLLLGLLIAIIIQKNLTENRAIKDFYIEEIKEVKKNYGQFLSNIYKGQYTSKEIKDWLKIMSVKINTLQKGVEHSYYMDNIGIYSIYFDMQIFITSNDEYNDNWGKGKINFSEQIKNDLIAKHSLFSKHIIEMIVKINVAKNKGTWWRKILRKNYVLQIIKNPD